jgi:hypothetical protein
MIFIETPTFTWMVTALLTDEEYRALQTTLADDPERGALIRGGGGIRKIRCTMEGTGKSGGIRIIYYWLRDDQQILMLVAYPKSQKDTLTAKEIAILRALVKEL